jgi:hypothetical protein
VKFFKKRRLANQVVSDACESLGLPGGLAGRVQFAAKIHAGDGEALLALEQARLDVASDNDKLVVGSDDWDEIFEMIMKIIELLMLIAPFFI